MEAPHLQVECSALDNEAWLGAFDANRADLYTLFEALPSLRKRDALQEGVCGILAWQEILPGDVCFIRRLGRRTVQLRLRYSTSCRDIVVKVSPPNQAKGLRRLTESVERSGAHTKYQWRQRLAGLSREPRALGFLERASEPGLAHSFFVDPYIYGHDEIPVQKNGLVARSLPGFGGFSPSAGT